MFSLLFRLHSSFPFHKNRKHTPGFLLTCVGKWCILQLHLLKEFFKDFPKFISVARAYESAVQVDFVVLFYFSHFWFHSILLSVFVLKKDLLNASLFNRCCGYRTHTLTELNSLKLKHPKVSLWVRSFHYNTYKMPLLFPTSLINKAAFIAFIVGLVVFISLSTLLHYPH